MIILIKGQSKYTKYILKIIKVCERLIKWPFFSILTSIIKYLELNKNKRNDDSIPNNSNLMNHQFFQIKHYTMI